MATRTPDGEADLYSVLEVTHTATPSEIKKSYQKLAKECHPDKLPPNVIEKDRALAVDRFHAINKAYKILSDEEERAHYDIHNNCAELTQKMPITDTVDLDEMTFDSDVGSFSLSCRCGGSYVITEVDMEGGVEVVCCTTCTLCVRVLYQLAQDDEEETL